MGACCSNTDSVKVNKRNKYEYDSRNDFKNPSEGN